MRCKVPIVRSVGAIKSEAYAAAPISDTTIAAKMARFHIALHSSRRYSPKSHNAVKNTMSNATRNPMPFHNTYGDRSSSAAVTSVLAINIGVSIGNNNSGKSSSRILACAEIDDSAVPAIETPRLPRKNTSTSQGNTLMTDTLYITANTGSSKSSITIRNNVFAASFARKIANGSGTESRSALSVSFVCSRKKHGCSINDAANKNASHSNPDPNRRASSESGSNVKLNSTSTMTTKMTVVVSSSRDRNSVFSSLPNSTVELAIRLTLSVTVTTSKQPRSCTGAAPLRPSLARCQPYALRLSLPASGQHRSHVRTVLRIRNHRPGIEPNSSHRERRYLRLAVQAHQQCASRITHSAQRSGEPRNPLRIEPRRRFIQQQHRRFRQQRPCNRYALP